jgi:hypothetical protein
VGDSRDDDDDGDFFVFRQLNEIKRSESHREVGFECGDFDKRAAIHFGVLTMTGCVLAITRNYNMPTRHRKTRPNKSHKHSTSNRQQTKQAEQIM